MDLLSEHSEPFSATWPSSGMTRRGVAYELPTPVPLTVESASSSSPILPTPTVAIATGGNRRRGGKRSDELLLAGVLAEFPLLPTPAAHDSGNTPENHLRKKPGRTKVTSLKVMLDYDLLRTGGRIAPPSNDGSE
ncbi:hypothetical protein [Curtobacterium sp. Curtsp57]|uniref:hypothetical protein n=1 Tax=Curtobacterium sp. Curtsp57 TaxID=3243047 RepID=UPI0039B5BBAA